MENENYGFWNLYKRMWSFRSEKIYTTTSLVVSLFAVFVYAIFDVESFNSDVVEALFLGCLIQTTYLYLSITLFRVVGKFLIVSHIWTAIKFSKDQNKDHHKKSYDDLLLHLEVVNK